MLGLLSVGRCYVLNVVLIMIISACNVKEPDTTTLTNTKEENSIILEHKVNDLTIDSSVQDSFVVLETVKKDTSGAENFAFGKFKFGMTKAEVHQLNKSRQKLGLHYYNFSYAFNGKGELFAVTIFSDSKKALYYERSIQPIYTNLCRVIAEKYGKKSSCGVLPSVFDVMNSGTLWINTWTINEKKIRLGIKANKLDSYVVICKIVHIPMESAENKRMYRIKNKHIIESSEKF